GCCCCVYSAAAHRELHPFPTRRSSDLRSACCTTRRTCSPHPTRPRAGCRSRWATTRTSGTTGASRNCVARSRGRNTFRSPVASRSEEHTSELQSRENLVCRLLLEKKKA